MSSTDSTSNNTCDSCGVKVTKLSEGSVSVCVNISPIAESCDLNEVKIDFPMCDDSTDNNLCTLFAGFELTIS